MSEKITLTHLNIRQSIAILLTKLVLLDIILAFVVVSFYFLLVQSELLPQLTAVSNNKLIFLLIFASIGFIKIILTISVVLGWLYEYYEITPEHIVHKRGVIFRKTEMYNLNKVRAIDVKDSFLGELFNFASVTFYDIRLNKYLDMYLIHNPQRYVRILKSLRPDLELKTDHVNLPFLPNTENEEKKTQVKIFG